MRRKSLILAIAITLMSILAGCSDNEYLGNIQDISDDVAISFNGGTGVTTRAAGADAASSLNNSFVVYGFKTNADDSKSKVYDHYNVNFTNGTAHSTLSNTAGWEYVGQQPNALNTELSGTSYTQDIKYWDMAATQYDFIAFSAGAATQVNATPSAADQVQFSAVDNANLTTKAYTITGSTDDLTKVYISDRITAKKSATAPDVAYKQAVTFTFRPLAAKVRVGLYETIPGYSVKAVEFYVSNTDDAPTTTPALYAGSATIPSGNGIVNVSFPVDNAAQQSYNRAAVSYDSEGEKAMTLTLGSAFTGSTAPEQSEDGGSIYLGRYPSEACMTSDVKVVPAPVGELKLKINFTLVSIDYNETIEVKGVTAAVPAKYTDWQPNFAYTYIFKISDMMTDAFGQVVLYPITFDALETVNDFGVQQTITTVDQPSITTYAKGALANDSKYKVGDNIYVAVTNGTAKILDGDNSELYTVSTSLSEENITEKNITDGMDGITLTPVLEGFMTFTGHIDAVDSPSGDMISAISGSNFAKFTAGNAIYVFRYKAEDEIHYTQDEIDDALAIVSAGDYTEGDDPEAEETATKTAGDIKTPAEYHYKVIKIANE